MKQPIIRIPFEGIYNFRDLGGYMADGGVVKFGRVYRCDALHGLSENDQKTFKKLGITTVIDLRSRYEEKRHNNDYSTVDGINFFHISPLDRIMNFEEFAENKKEEKKKFTTEDMLELYKNMIIHCGEDYANVIKAVAKHIDAPLVYHCSEGKDRTGLVSALIYGICGVSKQDIIANYQISYTYISQKYIVDERYKGGEPVNTPPELMRSTLDFLEEKYAGIIAYLKGVGVTEEEMAKIKAALVEPCELY